MSKIVSIYEKDHQLTEADKANLEFARCIKIENVLMAMDTEGSRIMSDNLVEAFVSSVKEYRDLMQSMPYRADRPSNLSMGEINTILDSYFAFFNKISAEVEERVEP